MTTLVLTATIGASWSTNTTGESVELVAHVGRPVTSSICNGGAMR
jgi:hypothetical protein